MTRSAIPRHHGHQPTRGEQDRVNRMLDTALDMALDLTFPASDPVAITATTSPPSNALGTKHTELPDDCVAYRKTAVFTQDTVPAGLLRAHRTAAGVWALIHVLDGRLLYRINEPTTSELVIEPGVPGVIEPAVSHEIAPLGMSRFYVEFHRRPPPS
jgi:tellurite resistance-related uncharacterized protein